MNRCVLTVSIGIFGIGMLTSPGVELLRGPYLQVGTPNSMRIRWRTDEPTSSVVLYGGAPGALFQITGTLETTTEHDVLISGLQPRTRYYYSVGSLFETLAYSPQHFFVTSPLPGSEASVRLWAIGDAGTDGLGGEAQAQVRDAYLALTQNRPADVWLALGDNAYFAGEDHEYQQRFFNIYPDILRNTVLWPTLGNHETYSLVTGDTLPYFDMFTMPIQGEAGGVASGTENYYSFDYGKVHFISLDSELSTYQSPDAMLSWLRADLEANSREWTIAFWHSPPYSKGSHNSDSPFEPVLKWMREKAVPILEEHGVDLVLCGHSHIYERSMLVHGHYGDSSTLLPEMIRDSGTGKFEETGPYWKLTTGPQANQGTVYVVAGSSGWATYRTGHHPIMVADKLETGSLVVDIEGQILQARFVRENGVIDDHFTLIKAAGAVPLALHRIDYTGGDVVLHFFSDPGQTYQIETASDLVDPQWIAVEPTLQATGFTSRWSFRSGGIDLQRFFRITRLQEP